MLHQFSHPDRVVVGALGPVGKRRFVIQMRQRDALATLEVKREAILSIAKRIDSLLSEAVSLGWIGEPLELEPELGPLDAPVEVLFEVHAVGWALDATRGAIQLEFYSAGVDPGESELVSLIQLWLYPRMARQFSARARTIIARTDPSCPFCAQPVHPAGHICPRSNGLRTPLF
jgi:hypothetical protein